MVKVKLYDWGIASRQNDTIFINQNLSKYPSLFAAILEHEKSHTSGYAWHDFIIDINNYHLKGLKKEYYKFIIKNPSSWTELLPLWIQDKKVIINPFILLVYGIIILIIGVIGWFLI